MGLSDDLSEFPTMPGSFPKNALVISCLANKIQPAHGAAIWRLPMELLAAIFTECLESQFVRPCSKDAPLLLCRICSVWRQVAVSTPSLWSSIHIQLPAKTMSRSLHFGVQSWLSRSGALPLAIRIDACKRFSCESFDAFIPSFKRWRDVKLDVPNTSLPYLLSHSDAWAAQLTRLSLSYDPTINDCLDILARCPRLQEAFFASLLDSLDPVARPVVVLPDLHTLRIITLHDTLSILDSLELPLLRNLEIHFYFHQSWEKHQLFTVLLCSHSPMETLYLGGPSIPTEGVPHCDRRIGSSLKLIVSDPSTRQIRDIPISRWRAGQNVLDSSKWAS
jgi:hypothetical protein